MSHEKKTVISCYRTLNFYVMWRYMKLVNIGFLWLLKPRCRRRRYLLIVFFFYQFDAQILYFNTFIIFLYMFRALLCSSSGGQILLVRHLVSSLWKLTCFQSDDTRCCTNTIFLLKMSIIVLETCRGI